MHSWDLECAMAVDAHFTDNAPCDCCDRRECELSLEEIEKPLRWFLEENLYSLICEVCKTEIEQSRAYLMWRFVGSGLTAEDF
jgi:hypothetical protein